MKNIFSNMFKKKVKETVELSEQEQQIHEKMEKEFYQKAAWGIVASAIFLVLLFAITFFIVVDGQEDTKVPNLEGLKLSEAIIKLQDRALYPKLTLKNSAPNEKGMIISQDISPGSVVKAGRLIGLTASLGGVIDSVGSYEGQTLRAVKAELQKVFAGSSSEPLLIIGQAVEVDSEEPEGTILSQNPKSGTEITDITEIIFHVSRGKQESSYIVPTMKGLSYADGLSKITQWPIKYRFSVRNKKNNEESGMIVAQTPDRGTTVPWSTVVEMVMTRPEDYPSNFSFGLLEIVVPTSPVSVPMNLQRVKNDGSVEFIFESRTLGGALTIPYLEEVGSRLIVTVNDTEIQSFTVRQ